MKSGVSSFIGRHKFEIAIVILAIVLRLLYLGASLQVADGDMFAAIGGSDGYLIVSKNLIAGNGLTQDLEPPYTPYSFRPPAYHFFIVGTYYLLGGFFGVILLQILIGSLLPLIGMALASHLVPNQKIARVVGIILAIEPSGILYSTMFYSEIFFMLLFWCSLWALYVYFKNKQLALLLLSALLLGLATLTRPAAVYVCLLVVATLLWDSRKCLIRPKLVHVGIYMGIFALVLSPWLYRNYVTFGVAGLSPQTGTNLYTQLLPTVYSIDKGTLVQQEFNAITATGALGPNLSSITDNGPYTRMAIPLLLAHPEALTLSVVNSIWSFFTMDGLFDFLRHIDIRPGEMLGRASSFALFSDPGAFFSYFARNLFGPLAIILTARLVWIGITIMFIYGVWRYFKIYGVRIPALLALGIILYTAVTACVTGFGLTARYRLSVNPLILTFAVYGIAVALPLLTRFLRRFSA